MVLGRVGEIALYGLVALCLVTFVLRQAVISCLHRTGRFEEVGKPRRVFFSDELTFPTRVLLLSWRFERADRWLIRAYFVATTIGLLGFIVYGLVWFFSR